MVATHIIGWLSQFLFHQIGVEMVGGPRGAHNHYRRIHLVEREIGLASVTLITYLRQHPVHYPSYSHVHYHYRSQDDEDHCNES